MHFKSKLDPSKKVDEDECVVSITHRGDFNSPHTFILIEAVVFPPDLAKNFQGTIPKDRNSRVKFIGEYHIIATIAQTEQNISNPNGALKVSYSESDQYTEKDDTRSVYQSFSVRYSLARKLLDSIKQLAEHCDANLVKYQFQDQRRRLFDCTQMLDFRNWQDHILEFVDKVLQRPKTISKDKVPQLDFCNIKAALDTTNIDKSFNNSLTGDNTMRPTPYEFAWMANQAYVTSQQNALQPPIGWETVGHAYSSSGTSCVAFHHKRHKLIVLAIRGTVLSKLQDLKQDVQLAITKIQHYLKGETDSNDYDIPIKERLNAFLNTYKSMQQRFTDSDYRFYFTGHSLGGLIAGVAALQCKIKAMIFDPPGFSKTLVPTGIDAKDYITTYLAAPHLINTLYEQVGQRYMLYIPDLTKEQIAQQASSMEQSVSSKLNRFSSISSASKVASSSISYGPALLASVAVSKAAFSNGIQAVVERGVFTLHQHKMGHILMAFNPQTGQPWHKIKIRKWPCWQGNLTRMLITVACLYFPENSQYSQQLEAGLEDLKYDYWQPHSDTLPTAKKNLLDSYFKHIIFLHAGLHLAQHFLTCNDYSSFHLLFPVLLSLFLIGDSVFTNVPQTLNETAAELEGSVRKITHSLWVERAVLEMGSQERSFSSLKAKEAAESSYEGIVSCQNSLFGMMLHHKRSLQYLIMGASLLFTSLGYPSMTVPLALVSILLSMNTHERVVKPLAIARTLSFNTDTMIARNLDLRNKLEEHQSIPRYMM